MFHKVNRIALLYALFFSTISLSDPITPASLENAVRHARGRVIEFSELAEMAKQRNLRLFLFGGTAASFAHYVKWAEERKNQLAWYLYSTRSQIELFDAPFGLQLRQTQKMCWAALKAASAHFFCLPRFAPKCTAKNAQFVTALSIHPAIWFPSELIAASEREICTLHIRACSNRKSDTSSTHPKMTKTGGKDIL